tara:strand:+ start:4880 stop:6232 length:1353 start_codon:yes stop_codon:yes gene_type:complete
MQEFEEKHEKHIEEILNVLETDQDRAQIVSDLHKFVDGYKIDISTARAAVIRKYGGNPEALFTPSSKPLAQIVGEEPNVNFRAKLLSVNQKEITLKDGNKRQIYEGTLGDSSAVLRYTSWQEEFPYEAGTVVDVGGAYSKVWNERIDVNMGDRAIINVVEDEALSALEIDVGSMNRGTTSSQECTIATLQNGMNGVNLNIRVLDIEKREFVNKTTNETKNLWSGQMADASGVTRFTAWKDTKMEAGKAYRIESGYVKEWQGVPDLNIGDYTTISPLELDDLPPMEAFEAGLAMPIEALAVRGGSTDVVVDGYVINVREGSGLIFRCTDCKRVLRNNQCMVHGKQDGNPDLRTKAIVDDGTGSVTTFLDNTLTEQVLGKTLDDCLESIKSNFNPESIKDDLEKALKLKPVKIRGFTRSDDYGMMFFAKEVTLLNSDSVKEQAENLISEMGV